jgi:hypothetical protein
MDSGRVYGLNQDYKIIKEFKYIEFEWIRKYYNPGEFSLYVLASEYSPDVKFIRAEAREGIGIVQKIDYNVTIEGEFLTIQGFLLEKRLDYYTTELGKSFASSSTFASQLTTYFKVLGVSGYTLTDPTSLKLDTSFDAHEFLGEAIRAALQSAEYGYKLDKTGTVTFYKGADSGVVFAIERGNCSEISYTDDISNVRERCKGYIKVESGTYDVKNTLTGDLYVVATYGIGDSIVSTEFQPDSDDSYTAAQLRNQIKTAGKTYLLDYMEENDIDVTPLDVEGSQYLTDYDLGDIVKVATTSLGVVHSARVTEINELWKSNTSELTVTIGNKRRIKR